MQNVNLISKRSLWPEVLFLFEYENDSNDWLVDLKTVWYKNFWHRFENFWKTFLLFALWRKHMNQIETVLAGFPSIRFRNNDSYNINKNVWKWMVIKSSNITPYSEKSSSLK